MTDSKVLIDSSVWILYLFAESPKAKEIIENQKIILTSVLSIFEIKRKLLKEKYIKEKILNALEFIKVRSLISELTEEICVQAADYSAEHELSAIDSLIYTTAKNNHALLITADNDFRGLKEVEIV